MPTLHREAGFRFQFFASDGPEPPHVHVLGNGGTAKVWLRSTIEVTDVRGYDVSQCGTIERVAMSSPPGVAAKVWCDDRELFVELTDGRLVRHALPDFVVATPVERRGGCVVEGFGTALCWPDLDECVGVNWIFGVSEDVIYDLAGFERRPVSEDGRR